MWNPNGRELFYRERDKMMSVSVTTEPAFSAGMSKVLFERPYVRGTTSGQYDYSVDRQNFLMLKEGEETPSATQIHVVLDWFRELQERVPVK